MEAILAIADHGVVLISAIVLITAALAFYSTGVWSERRVGRLRWRHAALFGAGLVLDASGTALMTLIAAESSRDRAGAAGILNGLMAWTGAAALALMAVHLAWAVVVLIRNRESERLAFHRFSLAVWALWLIPYLAGALGSAAQDPTTSIEGPTMIKKLFTSAAIWTTLGLASGLFYREFTRQRDFTGFTQLSVAHTHALALGTIILLVVLALTKVFALDADRRMRWFLLFWNAGLALTFTMMLVKGSLQVLGATFADSPMIAGISGLGHMILTGSFVLFFLILRRALKADTLAEPATLPARG